MPERPISLTRYPGQLNPPTRFPPMPDNPEPVSKHLRGDGLMAFRLELQKQARLLQIVRQALPEFMGEHCRHCVLEENDRLLIYTESAAFSYQLRFYGPSLIAKIAENTGLRLKDVRIRNLMPVGVEQARYNKPRVFEPPLGGVGETLRESAANSPHDEVRAALLRLSQTVEEFNRRKEAAATEPKQ